MGNLIYRYMYLSRPILLVHIINYKSYASPMDGRTGGWLNTGGQRYDSHKTVSYIKEERVTGLLEGCPLERRSFNRFDFTCFTGMTLYVFTDDNSDGRQG